MKKQVEKIRKITVTVPATTANFGSGFDTFGAALELRNTLVAEIDENFSLSLAHPPTIIIEGEGKNELPSDGSNLIWKTMVVIFKKLKLHSHPITRLKLINKIPLSSGLGSSAAAIAGGLLMANEITGGRISYDEVVNIAARLEGHPDNIVPAIVGGFCICYNHDSITMGKVHYLRLPIPDDIKAVVTVPFGIRYSTVFARGILPEKISLKDAVFNLSRSALLAASIAKGDKGFYDLIREGMRDKIHQPRRLAKIPGAREAIEKALSAGALGSALSGSGPSVLAITRNANHAHSIARALEKGFATRGIRSRSFILKFTSYDNGGATVVRQLSN